MRYAVVIEKAGENYSAYVPDLPGCIATGTTVAETEVEIRDAIRFHIEGLREDGLPVPEPVAVVHDSSGIDRLRLPARRHLARTRAVSEQLDDDRACRSWPTSGHGRRAMHPGHRRNGRHGLVIRIVSYRNGRRRQLRRRLHLDLHARARRADVRIVPKVLGSERVDASCQRWKRYSEIRDG